MSAPCIDRQMCSAAISDDSCSALCFCRSSTLNSRSNIYLCDVYRKLSHKGEGNWDLWALISCHTIQLPFSAIPATLEDKKKKWCLNEKLQKCPKVDDENLISK